MLEAATAGRVRQIFVAEDAQPADIDLLNQAAVEGLRTGAELFSFAGAEMPGFGPIVAVLRY
ncbi:MAG: hypothetical protein EXQ47_09645 [Bryobacterales bacterium]|nr:hypothetical protein [Bryobacterales bacterium]